MVETTPSIEAKIQGDISGQVIVGNHNVQVLAEHGALVNVITGDQIPQPRLRPTPVLTLRPRRFQGLLDRKEEIRSVISGLSNGPVEVYGESGMGKTSMLRHLAYHPEVERFRSGAIYRLARREAPADLLQFIFEAFYETDVPFKPTDTQVRHLLRDTEGLILLDDVEQPREEIEGLTNAVPSCAFVIASTERRIWEAGQSIGVNGLPIEDAVALVEREIGRSLAPEEVDAARTLFASVEGNPLRIQQEVATVRNQRRSLITLVQPAKPAQDTAERIEESLSALPDAERLVLATLAAFGGASVRDEHLAALCALPDLESVLRRLQQRNFVQLEDSRYHLTGNLAGLLERAWDLTTDKERAVVYFLAWAERNRQSPDDLLKEASCIQELLGWASSTGRWREVQRLGRSIEGALTLSGRWEAWKSVVQSVLRASRALGDKAGEGWALHQLGTRALCLSDTPTAKAQLGQALKIRESLDDRPGAAVTRHNLDIIPVVTPGRGDSDSSSAPVVSPTKIPLLLKIGGSAFLLSLAVLGIRFILAGNSISQPTALAATSTPSHVSLVWVDNSDDETEFRIERRKGTGAFSEIGVTGSGTTTFNDPIAEPNTSYVYRVRAVNADGASEYSNEPTVLTFPAVPADLTAHDVPPGTVELRWTDRSPNPSGFKIERSTDAGATFIEVATAPTGRTTYSDTAGTANATRYYRVRATNAAGDSDYSKTVMWSSSPEPPGAPRLIGATAVSSTQTILRWTDANDNEAGFKIERKTDHDQFQQVGEAEPNTTTYEDRGVTGDASYSYRIRATNVAGDSPYSNEVSVTTPPELPAAPTDLAARIDRDGSVRLSWSDNSHNEIGFRIERKSNRDSRPKINTVSVGTERFSESDLAPDTRYTYRVQAYNRAGPSAFSNEASVATASAPGTISVSTRQISFGVISVGSTAGREVTIQNVGPGLLTGSIAGPSAPFAIVSGQETFAITERRTVVIRVAFEPQAPGRVSDRIVINTNDPREREVEIKLLGVGQPKRDAVRLLSLDLAASSVVGGKGVRGKVTLTGAAPESGAAVSLSSESRAVKIPASVTINAGDTSASFIINTNRVRTSTRAAIAASYLGETKAAFLDLLPQEREPQLDLKIESLDLSRSSVKGGESLEGTVRLSGRARFQGAVVTLASRRFANVPTSVTIDAGKTSARFIITTSRVRTSTRTAIIASLGEGSKTAALELEPEERDPHTDVTLASLDVGRDRVTGGESTSANVTLKGRAPHGGVVVTLSGSPILSLPASVTINAGNTSASFRIHANTVRRITRAAITAMLGEERKNASLVVLPEASEPRSEVGLLSLELHPNRVKGGGSVVGTVTLSGGAPQTLLVNLTSSNRRIASVPATVRVDVGSSGATFKIPTLATSSPIVLAVGAQTRRRPQQPVVIEITAHLSGASRSAKLEVW